MSNQITYSQEHLAEAARVRREWERQQRRAALKSVEAVIAFFVGLTLVGTVFFGLVNHLSPGMQDFVGLAIFIAVAFWLGRRWERDH